MWHKLFCFWFFVIGPAAICNWSSWKLPPRRGSCGSNPDHQPTRLWQVNTHGLLVREDREHVCLTGVRLFIIFTKATLYSSNSVCTDQHCQGLKAYSRVPLKLIPLGPPLYVWNTEASIIGGNPEQAPHYRQCIAHTLCMYVCGHIILIECI